MNHFNQPNPLIKESNSYKLGRQKTFKKSKEN